MLETVVEVEVMETEETGGALAPRMVSISLSIKAQGMDEPTKGHFLPLGQYTSLPPPCRLMLSLEQGKQNLCSDTDGHCTKCVSSSRSLHKVHLRLSMEGWLLEPPEMGSTLVLPPGTVEGLRLRKSVGPDSRSKPLRCLLSSKGDMRHNEGDTPLLLIPNEFMSTDGGSNGKQMLGSTVEDLAEGDRRRFEALPTRLAVAALWRDILSASACIHMWRWLKSRPSLLHI